MGRSKRFSRMEGQFVSRLIEMTRSDAFGALSLSGHRVLARIEVEHGDHGGRENGKLPVTFDDFELFGIDRHAISPAIRECVALGFLEVAERGRAGNAEFRKASLYRLTYLHTATAGATHEWRAIKTKEAAEFLTKAARQAGGGRAARRPRSSTVSTPKAVDQSTVRRP